MGIQNTRAWGRLVDAFGLTGRHKLLLDEVVVPVVLVEDVSGPDSSLEDDATMSIFCNSNAGTTGACVFSNFGFTGAILLLDRITIVTSAAMQVLVLQTTIVPVLPIAASNISKTWNDPSRSSEPSGTGFANEGVFGGGDEILEGAMLANTPYQFDVKQVVPPNHQIAVQGGNTNSAIRAAFQYRVRTE